ncbi:MAG TPA: hypothetical protein VFC42_10440 [Methylomirabilota bacterium]|jgi:hypothetical protein|nr:hypothetical protein [Methylomirabilota bacterium]
MHDQAPECRCSRRTLLARMLAGAGTLSIARPGRAAPLPEVTVYKSPT